MFTAEKVVFAAIFRNVITNAIENVECQVTANPRTYDKLTHNQSINHFQNDHHTITKNITPFEIN